MLNLFSILIKNSLIIFSFIVLSNVDLLLLYKFINPIIISFNIKNKLPKKDFIESKYKVFLKSIHYLTLKIG